MLKKTITYENFNGETVSEDFFFHLSKAELVELEMSHKDGLSATLERIVAAENNQEIIKEFKNIILTAYGKRSEDGRRFIKNQELRDEFVSTEAYSALFMELVTDTDAAVEFVNGIVPKEMVQETAEITKPSSPPLEAVSEPKSEKYPDGFLAKVARGSITRAEYEELNAEAAEQVKALVDAGDLTIEE